MTLKYPAEELNQAGAPHLPEGFTYAFEVGKSGDLHGAIFDPSGSKTAYDRIWVGNLFQGTEQIRKWELVDLVEMAGILYAEAFPSPSPQFIGDIGRFLNKRLTV